jgi:DNA-binding NtrC family response regulator
MAAVRSTILSVADSDATVLIRGESGTGKELAARTIHRLSKRAGRPFVVITRAAVPSRMLESELFGDDADPLGRVARRQGRFLRASGGTAFLDEAANMSPRLEARIQRVQDERSLELPGGELVAVDVRLIIATSTVSATSSENSAQIQEVGSAGEDMRWRLAEMTIDLPPLHERGNDVQELAEHFVTHYARECKRPTPRLAGATLDLLRDHDWPGNVRELRHAIERAVLLAESDTILPADVRLKSDDLPC